MKPFHFIQLADPQFGMFAHLSGMSDEEIEARRRVGSNVKRAPKIEGFAQETALFEEAISEANRLKPAFVVVCGDMIMDWRSKEQIDEVFRIAGKLADDIPVHWVPGNHDVGADSIVPSAECLMSYRAGFGADYYAFQHGQVSFIVLNTSVMDHPEEVPLEWDAQLAFLSDQLMAARKRGSPHIVVFGHHPLFIKRPDEEDNRWVVPRERRRLVLELLEEHRVAAMFVGHMHRNNYARGGGLDMVASGSVGYPLGDDPSGYRVVKVFPDRIQHDYYEFGHGPESIAGNDDG